MRIKGRHTRYVTTPSDGSNGWESITEDADLFLLGIFNEGGVLSDYVRSGRPSTYRVYASLIECNNGIRAQKSYYVGVLKPVRILTGEVVEKEPAE